ncbi:putative Protein VAC14 like protein [Blattamonas nauphoetae]|uniref:Vacuolar protein 14 C-terminal Fig4-binding domain-containing protein n=1 Tax=Blattamonas nauphoetae TaxID=2049346 RepID=A0ABQ9Y4Q5_9EUKA|nr:putative Protein VAC14 like protein [Blattamonas nauphoetae]
MSVLTDKIARALSDKDTERRRQGAQEIEAKVKILAGEKRKDEILQLITALKLGFLTSTQSNSRKGGLAGLSAVAIVLGQDCNIFASELFLPQINALSDQVPRVRFYACESLFNTLKAAGVAALPFFNELFPELTKLSCDPEEMVRSACEMVSRTLKEIVITSPESFNLKGFIPVLTRSLQTIDPNARQFILGWIQVLLNIPSISLLPDLAIFFPGLFEMLSESDLDIRSSVEQCLASILAQIKSTPSFNYDPIAKILIQSCGETKNANIKIVAFEWLDDVLTTNVYGKQLAFNAKFVSLTFSHISNTNKVIQDVATKCNQSLLMTACRYQPNTSQLIQIISVIEQEISSPSVLVRTAAMQWISQLISHHSQHILPLLSHAIPTLMRAIAGDDNEIARLALDGIAQISNTDERHFQALVLSILRLFESDRRCLSTRSSLILRQLSLQIDPERLYRSFASILIEQTEHSFLETPPDSSFVVENYFVQHDLFAVDLVQALNIILISSAEMLSLRRTLARSKKDGSAMSHFVLLFKAFSHDPVAALCLCLFSSQFHLASLMMKHLTISCDVTLDLLVQFDRFVHLFESPAFTQTRLLLLHSQKKSVQIERKDSLQPLEKVPISNSDFLDLHSCLHSVLMLLPQSESFHILSNRLKTAMSFSKVSMVLRPQEPIDESEDEDMDELVEERKKSLLSEILAKASTRVAGHDKQNELDFGLEETTAVEEPEEEDLDNPKEEGPKDEHEEDAVPADEEDPFHPSSPPSKLLPPRTDRADSEAVPSSMTLTNPSLIDLMTNIPTESVETYTPQLTKQNYVELLSWFDLLQNHHEQSRQEGSAFFFSFCARAGQRETDVST